jgi:hypothetical protein
MEFFHRNKRMFFSVVIFQEFIKEVTTILMVKELVVDMVEAYKRIKQEDVELECSIDLIKRQNS